MTSVDEYIMESSELQRRLFYNSRLVIKHLLPNVEESISYGVPFFSLKGKLCYFNRLKVGIDIGFVKGYLLSDEEGKLCSEGRKEVKSIRWNLLEDFDETLLRQTLTEAVLINEMLNQQKKRK